MKKIVIVLAFLGLVSVANAVEPMFIKGDKYVNIGAYGGIGFESNKYRHIFSGVRGTFHYPIIEDLDTYAGGSLGLCFDHDSWGNYGPYFITGLFIGANYPLTKNIIVFGEVGSGIAHLHGGLTLFF